MKSTNRHRGGASRVGFTLVELIVVMGIIALLASMVIVALATFGATSRQAATETLVNKIDKLIVDRLGSIDRYFVECHRRAGDPTRVRPPDYLRPSEKLQWANYPNSRDGIELLGRKNFIRRQFPMRFQEIDLNNDGNPDVTPGASHKPETENAEVLYYFLTNSTQFGSAAAGVGEFSTTEVADTDEDGLPELIDAWGNPLRFYRWPTRLIRPQAAGSEGTPQTNMTNGSINTVAAARIIGNLPSAILLTNDPDDPLLRFTQVLNNVGQFETNYHTARTWHVALVLSAGEDNKLGLFEPTDKAHRGDLAQPLDVTQIANLTALDDNISSLQLRTGGK